jgi:hypothetical protein
VACGPAEGYAIGLWVCALYKTVVVGKFGLFAPDAESSIMKPMWYVMGNSLTGLLRY